MIEGSQPAMAIPLMRARIFKPSSLAFSSLMINIADAPSDSADDVPAVTVPFAGSKTGRS